MSEYLLSRATLSPRADNLSALLVETAAADGGHRLAWTLFPQQPDAKRDFLYRSVDGRTLMILSQRAPHDEHGLWKIDTKRFAPEIAEGDRFGFILRANPAVAPRKGSGDGARRADAVMHAKQKARSSTADWGRDTEQSAALDWLFAREERLGFAIDRERTLANDYVQHRIARKGGKAVRFSSIDYEGLLQVEAPDLFLCALHNGIGKAKAFGCGLMLIRRAPR